MTESIQPRSWKTAVYVTDNDSHIQKPETEEDNMSLLFTLSNSLNKLYENINMFNNLVKKYEIESKKFEQILHKAGKGDTI
jgi:hypothetical protein